MPSYPIADIHGQWPRVRGVPAATIGLLKADCLACFEDIRTNGELPGRGMIRPRGVTTCMIFTTLSAGLDKCTSCGRGVRDWKPGENCERLGTVRVIPDINPEIEGAMIVHHPKGSPADPRPTIGWKLATKRYQYGDFIRL